MQPTPTRSPTLNFVTSSRPLDDPGDLVADDDGVRRGAPLAAAVWMSEWQMPAN